LRIRGRAAVGSISVVSLKNIGNRSAESDCRVISLLAVLEEENRKLRSAVIDLSLETLRLREALCRSRALAGSSAYYVRAEIAMSGERLACGGKLTGASLREL